MPKTLVFILLFIPVLACSQFTGYRFQTNFSYQTMLDYGRTLYDVSSEYSSDFVPVYKTERYKVRNQPLGLSNALNISFSINWLNRDKWIIEQSISIFFEKYSEDVQFQLVDIGNGDTVGNEQHFTDQVKLGYRNGITYSGNSYGTVNDITLLYRLKSDLFIGGGISHLYRIREEWIDYHNYTDYIPWGTPRTKPGYLTNQLAITFHLKKNWGRFSGFIKLHQSILTLKKEENKGAQFFEEGYTKGVVSHNLDYRFPMIIRAGLSIGLKKIRKKCGTCDF